MNYYNPTSQPKRGSLLSRIFGEKDESCYFTSDHQLEWKSKNRKERKKDNSFYNRNRCSDYYIVTEKTWYPKTQIYILY